MSESKTPSDGSGGYPADLSGRQLGDFHLLRRLGRGGMAEVYLAEQESLGRHVAVKVLKQSLVNDESYVRRFAHEAKAAASLVHANIVQIHEVGCIDGIHFIAQEYVEGLNLKQVIDREGSLGAASAVNVMRQVAAALHKAAQQRITHRDVKPENIMLSPNGEVKVADFGLARVEKDGESVNLTQVGVTMGTPLYMSPEQVEGHAVDVRSDIYSFGVTCFYMLAGRPPFEGDGPLKVAVQHLHDDPPRLEDRRPDLPEGLCRIVHRMLEKRPKDRYQSASDLLRDLRALQIEGVDDSWPSGIDDWSFPELLAARTDATQQLSVVMRRKSSKTGRTRDYLLAALCLVACLLVGIGAAWATRPPSLLHVADDQSPVVAKQQTVREQYFHAMMIGTEEAWESVAEFFPPNESEENRYYGLRASQRLAEMHLENGALDQAMRHYNSLAAAVVGDPQFRAVGLAGQANVHSARGESSLADQRLAQLVMMFSDLPRPVRQMLVNEVNPQLRPEFERLIREFNAVDGRGPHAMTPKNLFANLPSHLLGERLDTLQQSDGFLLERIISTGQATSPGEWYDQDRDEWVVLLRGEAVLRFESDDRMVPMCPGDYLHIPAHQRHRVEQTASDQPTVWLALHFNSPVTCGK